MLSLFSLFFFFLHTMRYSEKKFLPFIQSCFHFLLVRNFFLVITIGVLMHWIWDWLGLFFALDRAISPLAYWLKCTISEVTIILVVL